MNRRIDATVSVNGTPMEYVAFGRGERPLVILPGLSDGLTTVAGKSFILSRYYRRFAKFFRVYVFSRRRDLPERYTTRQMATDQGLAMRSLGLEHAFVIGVSQGGMVAQFLAIDQPELVSKLVLAVTTSDAGATVESVVSSWMNMARAGDYRTLVVDTMEKTYTAAYCKRMRPLYPIISRIGRPKSFDRFLVQARACIEHSATKELDRIDAPTLCIGGGDDHVVGSGQTEALAPGIARAELEVYPELGHGAFEETKAFNERMLEFLLRQ